MFQQYAHTTEGGDISDVVFALRGSATADQIRYESMATNLISFSERKLKIYAPKVSCIVHLMKITLSLQDNDDLNIMQIKHVFLYF
jgi:hypothetical protein